MIITIFLYEKVLVELITLVMCLRIDHVFKLLLFTDNLLSWYFHRV